MLPGRSRIGNDLVPVHLEGADLATICEAIVGKTVVVQRKDKTEPIAVERAIRFKGDCINFNDGNKSRSVKPSAIIAIHPVTPASTKGTANRLGGRALFEVPPQPTEPT